MQTIDVNSWEQFVTLIEELKSSYGKRNTFGGTVKNDILFRGQAKANWKLETTLERYSTHEWTAKSYAECALGLAPQIESFIERDWGLPSQEELAEEVKVAFSRHQVPCYEYWIYLRHCGFPSPLLDWTTSPYVASFFALAEQNRDAEKASVFVYVKNVCGGKNYTGGWNNIAIHGPYVRTHKRHFLQQSWYSTCSYLDSADNTHKFVSHEFVLAGNDKSEDKFEKDILKKITIPRAKRLDFLRHLQEMNINSFSLFQSEEALMQTLAIQEIEFVRLIQETESVDPFENS